MGKPKKQDEVAAEPAVVEETPAVEVVTEVEETKEVKTAKAGKRSEKAIKEVEEKIAKEERKAKTAEEEAEDKPKQVSNTSRSRLERQGKNFRKVAEKVEKGKAYSLAEALKLATETSPVKFDATVEMHIRLNVDPRHADQNIRDNLVLPAGTGKTVRVAVFSDDAVEGADVSGIETITGMLEKGNIEFDILVCTPANMPKLGKYARLLGPRGLMPNPKSGTVTTDIATAVKQAKAGRVEYRVDGTGIVHLGIGKVSFGVDKLMENARAVLTNIKGNKPSSVNSAFVKSIYLATTMGPSLAVETSEL